MINATQLLNDLKRQLKNLEDDLRARIADVPDLKAGLEAEWEAARSSNRTAETFESWADQIITQAGVHWLLSCVFIRFIEDNELVDRPWLGGTPESGRLALARDHHEAYFRAHPTESDREYLLTAFREAGGLPGLHTFFDEAHNPVFRLGISGDAAMALRQFWQQVDPNTGLLAHDFTDPDWNTRFLGDLYQDLSEATRKRYALLQTPEFVEEFILDRTLTPAIREFGFREVRMIDPTCGSGHFLLGGFQRLVEEWASAEPGRNRRDIAQKALDAVAGVDLNPFAVAIARFRLWVAALKVSDIHRLADAPNFKLSVAIGDSLLHGKRFGLSLTEGMFDDPEHYVCTGLSHAYASEDLEQVNQILGRQYHAVVGNPPYIVVKDASLNAAYRQRYTSCHMKYSLGAPFTERFFELAVAGKSHTAGFVGLITANSFMKREFGRKLIEQVLPKIDLTHVVDTSGAYIPGHGTPTVIMFGRHRAAVGGSVRTVMGIKGEPSTPINPAKGLVWSAIIEQLDKLGSESEFISVGDTPRTTFCKHPWSIGGGGAADLKESIEQLEDRLSHYIKEIGVFGISAADEVLLADGASFNRLGTESQVVSPVISGDELRDWSGIPDSVAIFPYTNEGLINIDKLPKLKHWLWDYRTFLGNRTTFAKLTYFEEGRPWWEWHQVTLRRISTPLTITFAEVATHNHFVLDRGGKVFKQTAPVIKLPVNASEDDHLQLLGLLNSSVVCFWLKQVCHQKQMMGGDGIRISEKSKVPYQFASTRVQELPLPKGWPDVIDGPRLTSLAREIDSLVSEISANNVSATIARAIESGKNVQILWNEVLFQRAALRSRLIFLQEEIDFIVYGMYGLTNDRRLLSGTTHWDVMLEAGHRPFCILEQRNPEGFDVPPDVPKDWPADLRELWIRRLEAIKESSDLRVIEDPHYKRRWIGRQGLFNHGSKANEFRDALADWLLDQLEAPHLWFTSTDHPPQLTTVSRLADMVRNDAVFMQMAELYAGHSGFDVAQIVADLVAGESIPFLSVLRYTDTGLRKRVQWEDTWALQRREDAGESVGKIPVPPKYQSKDFLKSDFWRLRGGLDVPKERWVSYPGCERGTDTSLVIAWAGWDHLQQATALAGFYLEMKDNEGWSRERLQPLLAGLLELVPWLKQWHNEIHPSFGERMGDYYEGFLNDQARELGFTVEDLRTWKPAASSARRGRRPRAETSNT